MMTQLFRALLATGASIALVQIGGMSTSAAAQEATAASTMLDTGDLVPLLQKGGYILLIRHERTEVPSRADDYSKPTSDCMAQRNLSVAGYAGSQETGVALKALAVPIGDVLASPMCRGMDTARFMFGRARPEPRLMHHDPAGARTLDVASADLKALVASLSPAESNIALVTHVANIWKAFDLSLAEGEIGVLQKQADGGVRVIGHAMGSDFGPYARLKLGPVPPVD